VGSLIARALSKYKLNVLVIEKGDDVAVGTTKANTGIVHAGYNAPVNSNKARMNVRGNQMFGSIASELHVDFRRIGDYVVATNNKELKTLEALLERGKKNGVPNLEIISRDKMLGIEPNLTKETKAALFAPTGGEVDPIGLAIAAMENAVDNGVKLSLLTEAVEFIKQDKKIIGIKTNRGTFYSNWVVNAAGLYADKIMKLAGIESEFEIRPRKGEYIILDPTYQPIHSILFPTPTEVSKGILVTTTVFGNVMVGPTSVQINDKEDKSTTPDGLRDVEQGGKKLVPTLDMRYAIKEFAGLRADGNAGTKHDRYSNMVKRDFILEVPTDIASGFVNLAGIESPGLASSPAIAEWVVNALKEHGVKMKEKKDFNPERIPITPFAKLSKAEQAKLIEKDPRFGKIVCRCENVTEGEIVRAIHSNVPALSYDAIKRRLHVGMGRCQGAFDTPRVIQILARELGTTPVKVRKDGTQTEFLLRGTKEVADERD
jgi:glycerol-3-phosphate dehydrogenase